MLQKRISMEKEFRLSMGKIPEHCFSRYFRELPPPKQIELRNKMRLDAVRISAGIERLADEIKEKLAGAKRVTDLNEAKLQRHLFHQRLKAVREELAEFHDNGMIFFSPSFSGSSTSIFSANPVERAAHHSERLYQEAKEFLESYSNAINQIEKERLKRR
jgi:hypothetical protein